jgi:hypothetical protein
MYVDPSGEITVVGELLLGGILAISAVALIVVSICVLASTGTLDDFGNLLNDTVGTIKDHLGDIKTKLSEAIITIAVATATDFTKKYQSGYYVYQLKDAYENVFYVGITKNLNDRKAAHIKTYGPGIRIDIVAVDVSLAQARVIETGLIALYTFDKLDNRRLSISNHRYVTSILLGKIESDLLLLIGR